MIERPTQHVADFRSETAADALIAIWVESLHLVDTVK